MTLEMILIALGLGVLTGFIVAFALRSQLKTVRPQRAAGDYIQSGSLQLTYRSDVYLYSNTVRVPKPQNNNRSKR